jgi:hypothetical protein
VSASSRESTASSHRAHLQRISRASSYAHEPSSQEPKLGRNDRLAAPRRTPPPDGRFGSRRRLEPLLSSTQELHHGTAAGHGCSVRSCRVRAARAGWRRPWPHPGAPEDALGPSAAAAADDLLTGTIRSRRKSWAVSASASASSCEWTVVVTTVSVPIRPASTKQRELQVREATTLTHPGALAVHGHAAADHQVHGLQLAQRQSAARRAPSRDRGGAPRWDVEPRRVEEDEGTLVGQAGHSHVQELAVGQGACPDRELGGVGVGLTIRAARHTGSEVSRAAVSGAPAKLGIRPLAPGKPATARAQGGPTRARGPPA